MTDGDRNEDTLASRHAAREISAMTNTDDAALVKLIDYILELDEARYAQPSWDSVKALLRALKDILAPSPTTPPQAREELTPEIAEIESDWRAVERQFGEEGIEPAYPTLHHRMGILLRHIRTRAPEPSGLRERFLACRNMRDSKYVGWKISGRGSLNTLAKELDPDHGGSIPTPTDVQRAAFAALMQSSETQQADSCPPRQTPVPTGHGEIGAGPVTKLGTCSLPPVEPSGDDVERVALAPLYEILHCAWHALDDSEDRGDDGTVIMKMDADNLIKAIQVVLGEDAWDEHPRIDDLPAIAAIGTRSEAATPRQGVVDRIALVNVAAEAWARGPAGVADALSAFMDKP